MKKIFKKGLTNQKECCIIGTSIFFFATDFNLFAAPGGGIWSLLLGAN